MGWRIGELKIAPVAETIRSLETVRERQDGHSRQQHQQNQKNPRKEQEDDSPRFEVTERKVTEAMASFKSDAQTIAKGLSVSSEGNGPGLKVVLKDGTGAVVRQFTGEEFVRLREAVSKDGRQRGKILDQKL